MNVVMRQAAGGKQKFGSPKFWDMNPGNFSLSSWSIQMKKRDQMTEPRRWYTGHEASEILRVKYKTLLTLAGRGVLPKGSTLRLGRAIRFSVEAIEAGAGMRGKKSL